MSKAAVTVLSLAIAGALVMAPATTLAQDDKIIPSLDLDQADIRDALKIIFKNAGYSYSVNQSVQGTVTVHLQNIPFQTALRNVLNQVGATYMRVESRLSGRAPDKSKATEADYRTLTSLEELRTWIAHATSAGSLAVDTETTSLDEARAELVGVSLAIVPNEACYVPLAHKVTSLFDDQAPELAPGQIALEDAIGALKPLLEDAAVLKVGQNIKYDMRVLARYGIEVAPVDDTMVISYVLDGGLHSHGMDELARLHLDHATISYKDVAGSGKAQVTFDQVPIERAAPYAAEDADVTLRLADTALHWVYGRVREFAPRARVRARSRTPAMAGRSAIGKSRCPSHE